LVSSEKLLELRSVSVNYGRFCALRDVSYKVLEGQTVCLLGGNASGKSTSMKAIFGTVPLASGEIYWRGERIDSWPTALRVQAGLAAVPEGRRVFARMTVQENLTLGACNRRDHAAIAQDMEEIYAMFPRLRERNGQLAGLLSGGEQQMLAIGRALMSQPVLVCMDEPSMGLSPVLVRQSFALIQQLQSRGIAVFVVEQNARAALKVADYGYVLRGGEMVLEGSPDVLSGSDMMRAAYLGKAR